MRQATVSTQENRILKARRAVRGGPILKKSHQQIYQLWQSLRGAPTVQIHGPTSVEGPELLQKRADFGRKRPVPVASRRRRRRPFLLRATVPCFSRKIRDLQRTYSDTARWGTPPPPRRARYVAAFGNFAKMVPELLESQKSAHRREQRSSEGEMGRIRNHRYLSALPIRSEVA